LEHLYNENNLLDERDVIPLANSIIIDIAWFLGFFERNIVVNTTARKLHTMANIVNTLNCVQWNSSKTVGKKRMQILILILILSNTS
jgi:hypothetical protein